MGPSWAHVGPSWALLGPLGAILKKSWKYNVKAVFQEAILGHLGAILGPSSGHLGPSWAHLRHLGAILGPLGPSWGHVGAILGRSWGHLGPILDHVGAILPPSCAILRSMCENVQKPKENQGFRPPPARIRRGQNGLAGAGHASSVQKLQFRVGGPSKIVKNL